MSAADVTQTASRFGLAPTLAADEAELVKRYQRQGDMLARERLVEMMLPLARRLAGRYRRSEEPQDDLEQVACLGLVKAINRFEPGPDRTLARYATPTILGELRRHFRDRGWAVNVPRSVQERVLAMNEAVAVLSAELGRSPSAEELAQWIGCTLEQLLEAKDAADAYSATSLDAPAPGIGDDEGLPYRDRLPVEEQGYELVELGASMAPILKQMSDRDRRMLHMRFIEDLTQSEIADRTGVSQMHVSRILRQALERLGGASEDRPV